MGNLKPAPLFLSTDLVAKLVGDRPAFGKGIARVPFVEPTAPLGKLVDRPRRSEDPRLAKANDQDTSGKRDV